jgi:peptidyl-prolyl cis-trans isomerase SDCCAG10
MTAGKVVLHTTVGPLDIELWSKEIPKATRNFVQLCMEGYYDNTIFHRIVRDYLVQGGDPTGTGYEGESIYGEPFKDEFHSRLRFSHRGLIACASFGRNKNGSQFFITLGQTPELDKKNTIFGKVTGNTLYNLLSMNTYDIDDDERPLKPPQIIKTEILWNPFDDIVPRLLKSNNNQEEIPPVVEKPKPVLNKNLSLLSFADEAEEEEETESNFKPISHFVPKRTTPSITKTKRTRDSLIEETSTDLLNSPIQKEDQSAVSNTVNDFEDVTDSIQQDPERDRIREETDKIIHELKSKKKKIEPEQKKAASEAKELLRKQREKYVKRGKRTEAEVMMAFESFRAKINDPEQSDWRSHQLNFEKDDAESKVKDPTLEYDDDGGLIVFDPLKDFKPQGEQLNKHQQRLRAKKNLEKW